MQHLFLTERNDPHIALPPLWKSYFAVDFLSIFLFCLLLWKNFNFRPDLKLELVDPSQMKVKPGELVKVKVTIPKVCNFQKYTGGSLNFDGSLLEDETSVTIGYVVFLVINF